MIEARTTFHGVRLREARQARALRACVLSDLADVSASSISQYENGKQIPSPQVIARLSAALNIPAHFFTTPPEPPISTCFRWRSQSAAKKAARDRAQQKYEWFRRIARLIEDRVELPEPHFAGFDTPDDPVRITQDDIDVIADEVRRQWGLGYGPISNLVRLVENNGGIVVRSELGDDALDAFSDFDPQNGRCYIILGADKRSAVRSRHNVAHELAHVFLHRKVPANVCRQSAIHKELESQADRFASAFLLPAKSFPPEVFSVSLDGLLYLKRRWGVAVSSMIMRLADLDLIDDAKKQSLFIQLSKRGWRRHEPLDDQIIPEQPKLIQRSLTAAIQAGVLHVDDLVSNPPLFLPEVERLLGQEIGQIGGAQSELLPPFQLRLTAGD